MGSENSANAEWIELRNDGPAVSVDGWVLDDGMNLSIELAGTIPANSYAVLERTSDDSAPGSAFFIYTGALVNTGATLKLRTSDGSLVDQVSGGEDWKNIGGDNVTKETAQYTLGGWITGLPTPGSQPPEVTTHSESSGEEAEVITSPKSKSRNQSETIQLELPDVSLQLEINSQLVAYVNQSIPFEVVASGVGQTFIESLQYAWNFGDGTVATGENTTHTYPYPGTYVVTVFGEYKRQKQVSRHEITVLPVRLSLTTNVDGDIQLHNESPYEIDISDYTVQGLKRFTFPSYSILLPNQAVTIPREIIVEAEEVMIAVYDAERKLVASKIPKTASTEYNVSVAAEKVPIPQVSVISDTRATYVDEKSFSFSSVEPKVFPADENITDVTQTASVAAAPEVKPNWSMLAFSGLLIIGIAGVLVTPRRNENG